MNLPLLIQAASKASYWSRGADEVLGALDKAARRLYLAVVNERKLAWLKIDTTSLAFVAGQSVYQLPADFEQMKQLAERTSAALPWRPMFPADPNSVDFTGREQAGEDWESFVGDCGPRSPYDYSGPYLDGAQGEAGTPAWTIEVAPQPQESHLVRMRYVAKYVPITSAESPCMMPDEAQNAMMAYATAHLLRLNSDQNAAAFEADGDKELAWFLAVMRDRQIQQFPRQQPYVYDLD